MFPEGKTNTSPFISVSMSFRLRPMIRCLTPVANGAGSSYVSRIGMWSLNRDSGCAATTPNAPTTCSGMQQANYSFSEEFEQF